ncbi:hypothetical protein D9611_000675 [Ephemerocybe angulata]|uniref:F-box domain-containing protein n=1 Tax=Ephemerocybe angulata TaxID=980116 RepID=A0A8H5F751_9AGAR|nr:hypothetical protein D9611_000675 [Tulosesus angulatus]
MSLHVGWNYSAPAHECHDVVMQDAPCWRPSSSLLRAGRQLSDWILGISPPVSPPTPYTRFLPLSKEHECAWPEPRIPSTFHAPPHHPSYIQSLPQELLEEIFREYIHSPSASSLSSGRSLTGSYQRIVSHLGANTTPMLLAHVCPSWRAVVLSYPALWSRLCVFHAHAADFPLLEFWLARISNSPLDLTIVQRYKRVGELVDHDTPQILAMTLRHASLRSVSLQLDVDMEHLFGGTTDSIAPSLEQFQLNLMNWSPEGCGVLSQLLLASPTLHTARWGSTCGEIYGHFDTLWSTLSTIELGHIGLSDLFTHLPQMLALQSLRIDDLDIDCSALGSEHLASINLPHLTTLSFGFYSNLCPLLDSLLLPSLTNLSLGHGFGLGIPEGRGWPSLEKLVERSHCRLLSFDWSRRRMEEDVMVRLFNHASDHIFPELEYLRICSPVGDQFVSALTLGGDSARLPCLTSLALRSCRARDATLISMVLSRPLLQDLHVKIKCSLYPTESSSALYQQLTACRPGRFFIEL